MIKSIIKCSNNMVIVFDRRGEQIPQYQGQYEKVKEIILKDAPPEAVFAHGFAKGIELQKVTRHEW